MKIAKVYEYIKDGVEWLEWMMMRRKEEWSLVVVGGHREIDHKACVIGTLPVLGIIMKHLPKLANTLR